MTQSIKKLLIGERRDIHDPNLFHKVSLVAFLAWVGLGADGLSSSAYGPEEAFRALSGHTELVFFMFLAMRRGKRSTRPSLPSSVSAPGSWWRS
jgi:hypothetical protein